MSERSIENAEKALEFFLAARRKAAEGLAVNINNGTSYTSAKSAEFALQFSQIQSGVEAALKAVDDEKASGRR